MELGQIVISKAGRDSGRIYIVLKAEKNRVLLLDGRERKLSNPKIKNAKHLEKTKTITAIDEETLSNKEIRKLISDFKKN